MEASKFNWKKWGKIALIIIVVIVVIYITYKMVSKSAGGNAYASATALAAGKSGSDGAWSDTDKPGFNDLFNVSGILKGKYSSSPVIYYEDAFGQAWFKGMNIKLTSANVSKYAADIAKYSNNASLRKAHWEVSTGSFLN